MDATKAQPMILILLLCAILALFLSTANAIRSLPTVTTLDPETLAGIKLVLGSKAEEGFSLLLADKNHILNESGILTEKSRNLPTGSPNTEKQMNDLEESCSNVEEEEECLMRRTLAAHVDYIYTQEHNRP